MKTSSCKAKGRRCVQEAKELILHFYPWLKPDDLVITSSGDTGEDLKMSPAAREFLPITIEAKCQEKIQIWSALSQSESHASGNGHIPVLIFKRNRSELYVSLKMNNFLELIKRKLNG